MGEESDPEFPGDPDAADTDDEAQRVDDPESVAAGPDRERGDSDPDAVGPDPDAASDLAPAEADTDGGVERVPADDPEVVDPGDPLDDGPYPDPDDEFPDDDPLLGDGPEYDEEMPLADHIEEMVRRLGAVLVVGGLVTLAVFGLGKSPGLLADSQFLRAIPSSTAIIDLLWNHNIPGAPADPSRRPRLYGPLELVLTELKVAGLAGLVVGLPVFVYQTYLFMRPGLYPNERRYYLAAVPTSLVLALIGIAFAHFVVLPSLFAYFTTYTQRAVFVAFGLKETFNLILVLMGYMAVIFQIPLFIMLGVMMNLVDRVWLEDRRLIFWGVFATVAFFATPDPTGMAPIIVGATMILLFEGTLALLRWTGN